MTGKRHHELDLVGCPQCCAPAQVTERFVLGGLAHVRVRCVQRHWFCMPAAGVPGAAAPRPAHPGPVSAGGAPSRRG